MRVPVIIISLSISAVLGLAAIFVAKTLLPGQSAKAGIRPAAEAGTPIVVASKDLKYGDKVDADHLRLIRVPADAAPQGAFTTVAAVLSSDRGGPPVVLTPIAAREPVLPAKLSGPGARPTVAAEIAEGMRAYTIRVSDVTGVGGHALPGDRVDVVLQRDLNPQGPSHNYVSQVVLQDVRVLAIDLNANPASDKPATPSTATLEVSVEDSQKLSIATELGKLSLALRRTGAAETARTTLVRTSAFAGGAPAGGSGARSSGGGSRRGVFGGPILIVYGDRRSSGGRSSGGRSAARAPAAPAPAAPAPAGAAPAPSGVAASLG